MLRAIKVTRENFDYVMEHVLRTAPWKADLRDTFESNLANSEWTYVIVRSRETESGTREFHTRMTESKFNEIYEFVNNISSSWMTTDITRK